MAIYESGEDYLETIYILSKQKQGVHAVDVANELGFSKPSVTRAMKLLIKAGYITIDERNHINLTKAGEKKAVSIYERHNEIAQFLMAHGISEDIAYKDACRMEHHVSDETYDCIKAWNLSNH